MWGVFKTTLEETSGLTRDALHIHAGIALMALALWLMGTLRWVFAAWLVVVLAAVGNELLDYSNAIRVGRPHDWVDSVSDVINTMLWPTVFMVVVLRRQR